MTILDETAKIAKVKTGIRKAIQQNYGNLTIAERFEVYPDKILAMQPGTSKDVDATGCKEYCTDQNLDKTLPNTITKIRDFAFFRDTSLKSLILESTTVIPIGEKVFAGTKIESGEGFIYVPDSLVNSYKTHPTWTEWANQIKPVSQHVDDTTQRNIIETMDEHYTVEKILTMKLEDFVL